MRLPLKSGAVLREAVLPAWLSDCFFDTLFVRPETALSMFDFSIKTRPNTIFNESLNELSLFCFFFMSNSDKLVRHCKWLRKQGCKYSLWICFARGISLVILGIRLFSKQTINSSRHDFQALLRCGVMPGTHSNWTLPSLFSEGKRGACISSSRQMKTHSEALALVTKVKKVK